MNEYCQTHKSHTCVLPSDCALEALRRKLTGTGTVTYEGVSITRAEPVVPPVDSVTFEGESLMVLKRLMSGLRTDIGISFEGRDLAKQVLDLLG